MNKNKTIVSIVSSFDGLNLAESLKDSLITNGFEVHVLTTESEWENSSTIEKMLDNVTNQYDFTVIILTRKDVVCKLPDQKRQRTRDNCMFMAGLTMGSPALGQNRCFLVSGARKSELPVNLHGHNFLYFNEPDDLTNDNQCKQALDGASDDGVTGKLIGIMKERGGIIRDESPPFLSFEEIMEKERIEGGDLKKPDQEKQEKSVVVVCDTLPIENFSWAVQIKENLDKGIEYFYFFHAGADDARRICRLLQMILVADFLKDDLNKAESFLNRYETIIKYKDLVLKNLKDICKFDSFNIYFSPIETAFYFRIHNAGNSDAKIYLRYGDKFVDWSGSGNAGSVYEWLQRFKDPRQREVVFCSNDFYPLNKLDDPKIKNFRNILDHEITLHFPIIDEEVRNLCYGKSIKMNKSGKEN
jgi:hypothetical protein